MAVATPWASGTGRPSIVGWLPEVATPTLATSAVTRPCSPRAANTAAVSKVAAVAAAGAGGPSGVPVRGRAARRFVARAAGGPRPREGREGDRGPSPGRGWGVAVASEPPAGRL